VAIARFQLPSRKGESEIGDSKRHIIAIAADVTHHHRDVIERAQDSFRITGERAGHWARRSLADKRDDIAFARGVLETRTEAGAVQGHGTADQQAIVASGGVWSVQVQTDNAASEEVSHLQIRSEMAGHSRVRVNYPVGFDREAPHLAV